MQKEENNYIQILNPKMKMKDYFQALSVTDYSLRETNRLLDTYIQVEDTKAKPIETLLRVGSRFLSETAQDSEYRQKRATTLTEAELIMPLDKVAEGLADFIEAQKAVVNTPHAAIYDSAYQYVCHLVENRLAEMKMNDDKIYQLYQSRDHHLKNILRQDSSYTPSS